MFQRNIHQVEMDPFGEQVGGDHHALSAIVEHGAIVAHPFEAAAVF